MLYLAIIGLTASAGSFAGIGIAEAADLKLNVLGSTSHRAPCPDAVIRIQITNPLFWIAGVAGFTWVAVMHTLLGYSFRTTLTIANLTSIAWLLCYYLLLKPAVSILKVQADVLSSDK